MATWMPSWTPALRRIESPDCRDHLRHRPEGQISHGRRFPRFDDVESGGYATDGGRQTVRDLLYDAERRLAGAGVPSPQADAAWLMAWVLDVPRSRLFLHDEPRASQRVQFERQWPDASRACHCSTSPGVLRFVGSRSRWDPVCSSHGRRPN